MRLAIANAELTTGRRAKLAEIGFCVPRMRASSEMDLPSNMSGRSTHAAAIDRRANPRHGASAYCKASEWASPTPSPVCRNRRHHKPLVSWQGHAPRHHSPAAFKPRLRNPVGIVRENYVRQQRRHLVSTKHKMVKTGDQERLPTAKVD